MNAEHELKSAIWGQVAQNIDRKMIGLRSVSDHAAQAGVLPVQMHEDEFQRRESTIAPTILTIDGHYFDFEDPESSTFDINTIAHALSNLCRFTGHCREFYSVAQHSVLVSHLVPPELALQGLLHDAVEAFVGDMSSPLKRLFPEYKVLEKRLEAVVLARFGLPAVLDPRVKRADLQALRTEQRDLMRKEGGLWMCLDGIEPDHHIIRPLDPKMAMVKFLLRFEELTSSV